MSDPDDLIDRVNELLRENVIDCFYRVEKLEQMYLSQEPGHRLPQLVDPQDVYDAMEDLKERLDIVEKVAEQFE